MIDKIKKSMQFIQDNGITNPEIGIILGTGLGKFPERVHIECELGYETIPHFPVSTVEFHSGKLISGTLNGKKLLIMQGRFHYYEGYTMQQVTFPVRVMKMLGINHLLISNAAGAINLNFKKGELMLIEDHINLLPQNPLIGKNHDELGTRFPDMSQPYSKYLNDSLLKIAKEEDIILHKGVYAAIAGPNLETRAEYRFLKTVGADAVGMSTVPEVIVANHMGLSCAAISVLTDECDPDNLKPVDITEIIKVAGKAETKLIELFVRLIELIK